MKSNLYLAAKLICYLLFNLFIFNASAQVERTAYYTKAGRETKLKDSAFFSRTIVHMTDQPMSYFKIVEHYLPNNTIKLNGTVQDTGIILKFFGRLEEFYFNGEKRSLENFNSENVRVDSAFYWYPNGKLRTISHYPFNDKIKGGVAYYIAHYDSLGNKTLENGNGFIRIEYDHDDYLQGEMENYRREGKWEGIMSKLPITEVFARGKLLFGVKTKENGTTISYDSTTYWVDPVYPRGMPKLMNFVSRHYKWPKEAKRNNVKGVLEISFVVNKEGYLEDIVVKKDLGFGTGEEGIRVLKMAERWKPGIQRGEPIGVMFTMPIRLDANP